MKIRYSYTEYPNCPEATEISKIRGIAFTSYIIVLSLAVFFSIASLILDFGANWYIAIPIIIVCIVCYIYLLLGYETATQRQVAKAIEEKNQAIQKKIAEEYRCLYVFPLDSYKNGHCEKCHAFHENLRECIVKDKEGERFVFICNSCITRYNQNKR